MDIMKQSTNASQKHYMVVLQQQCDSATYDDMLLLLKL